MPDRLFTLGDVVRKLREKRGWTQGELAAHADLDVTAIVRLEKRSDKSEQRTILRAAKALGVSLADLYAYAEPLSLSAEQREWARLLLELEPERREVVLQLARRQKEIQQVQAIASRSTQSADPSKTGTES